MDVKWARDVRDQCKKAGVPITTPLKISWLVFLPDPTVPVAKGVPNLAVQTGDGASVCGMNDPDIQSVLAYRSGGAIACGDVLEVLRTMPDECVQCCITSPPYFGLRDYGVVGQIGLEKSPDEYVVKMVEVFHEVRRVLRDDGVLFLNLGSSYAGSGRGISRKSAMQKSNPGAYFESDLKVSKISGYKPKDLIPIPWLVAIALQRDGWWLRSDIIWAKPNPMPESITDRPTRSHEYLFLLTKNARYYYDAQAIAEPVAPSTINRVAMAESRRLPGVEADGRDHLVCTPNGNSRNARTVWTIPTQSFREAHFATFSKALVRPCILAGTSERGCCPKCGKSYKRIVNKNRVATRPGTDTKVTGDSMTDGNRDPLRHVTESTTIGWSPTCKCDAGEPVGCICLDPFMGAGTVGLVASKLGRRYIGIELNSDYVAMAEKRIRAAAPLFA